MFVVKFLGKMCNKLQKFIARKFWKTFVSEF